MIDEDGIRHGRHCVFHMHVHLVFVTKFRRNVFTQSILNDLRDIFSAVCKNFEAELIEFDGEDDHVHLLINYPPKVAISHLVNSLKGVSSRMRGSGSNGTVNRLKLIKTSLTAQSSR